MTRQRKAKTPNAVPETLPSKMPPRPAPDEPLIQISEEEQWRIINESGILKSTALQDTTSSDALGERLSFSDELFNAVLLIIPFSSLLLLLEILIRHQYGKHASMEDIMDRMGPGVPILSLFIFYTTRYKSYKRMQFFLFLLSVVTGCRMIFQYRNASWLVNMKQCPPLATIWIYTIVQLDLGPAVLNLLVVGGFAWWKDLKII